MTLKEAIESGKPFRLSSWIENSWLIIRDNEIFWKETKGSKEIFTITELTSDKYILKYNCEECKDTKEVVGFSTMKVPCPKCYAPKYEHDTTCSASRDFPKHTQDKGCSCRKEEPKYKCNTCKDTKRVLNPKMVGTDRAYMNCPDCSAPPKMKKITVYRPVFNFNYGGLFTTKQLFSDKTAYGLGKVFNPVGDHLSGGKHVGWEPVEIEVLDQGEAK